MKAEMKIIKGQNLKVPQTASLFKSQLPEMRIDENGKILYVNAASQFIIRDWKENGEAEIPGYLFSHYPGLHDFNACFDIEIYCGSQIVKFDVVGFKEGGYIGLYACETEFTDFELHNNRRLN